MASTYGFATDSTVPPPRWLEDAASLFDGETLIASRVPEAGIMMGIDPYPGMAAGDLVRMVSVPVGGLGQPILGAWEQVEDDLRPRPYLRAITLFGLALEADQIDVHCQVWRHDVLTTSPALRVSIQSGYAQDRLAAPFVVMPKAEGVQPTDTNITLRTNVSAAWYGGTMALYLLGTEWTCFTSVVLPIGAATRTVVFTHAKGFDPRASAGGMLRAWCTMTRKDATAVSNVLSIPVAGIPPPPPPSPLVLGGDARIDAEPYVVAMASPEPAVAPNPPAHVTLTRVAEGGTPPYRYETSNPRVAAVDAQGTVVATGNGVASIRAIDAAGMVATCTVTVTGVTVVMPVRTPAHVGEDYRQTLYVAGEALGSIWFTPGVMAQLQHLRALWRQHRSLLPGLARKIGFDEESDTEAYYWVFDSTSSAHLRVNLNAVDESCFVETMSFETGATARHFIAMVETNMWNGFNDWYGDGEHARVHAQPFYSPIYGAAT
ncbi:hypothetical protein SAMN02800694_1165 [Luteibacter sp. UNCMF331Sha3.1]|uniref:hypothetical protein n=1 Tax=Luteibacter sp. UNCMF331Sha3.1 TaxID=1502760 RepID=UPI0008B4ADAB|nr:hypothetical protein [Luteibacter sp. UNCMF331Sha3.1]SEM46236.1 hypothetical protein SAMN02800694_1165 [Luteibacter sp. UNCMF331Sha3.1]